MRLIPSPEQSELRSVLRSVFDKECPTGLVRRWKIRDNTENTPAFPDALWGALSDLGVFGMTIDESFGGSGASLFELGIVYSEAGRALCPSVVYSTVSLGIALDRLACGDVRERYLSRIATGDLKGTVALWNPSNAHDLRPTLAATRTDGGWSVSGALPFVENADLAELLLTTATTSDFAEPARTIGVLIEPGGTGWNSAPQPTIAGEHLSRVKLDCVFVPDEHVLSGAAGSGLSTTDLRWLSDAAIALQCMEMAGGGAAVLERTVDYVRERHQFGHPIGSFQAVQHIIADIHISLDAARLTAASAVWWLSRGERAGRQVAIAKMQANEAYKWATLNAHQVHGGMGYVRETDLHLWSEQAKVSELRGGTTDVAARWLEEEIALA